MDNASKSQTLFPISIDYFPSFLKLTDISFTPSNNELVINIESKYDTVPSDGNNAPQSSNFSVNIPNEFLDEITNVTTSIDDQKVCQSEIIQQSIHNQTSSNETSPVM